MAQLRLGFSEFERRDTTVVVVGPEDQNAFAEFWEANDLPFVGLPDPEHRVLKLYGQEVHLFKLGRLPAQVLVDKSGIARFVHYGHDMKDIPTNEEVWSAIDSIEKDN